MDPFRYRKAYEAMIHASQLLEHRLDHMPPDGETHSNPFAAKNVAVVFEAEDTDSMEWTPTATETATTLATCGPPPSIARNMRHLKPDSDDDACGIMQQGDNAVLLHKLQERMAMDACVDKLVRDLPDILNYDSSASFTPSTIEVPKDFGLQLSISINHHLAQVADQKVLEKYRRLLGHRKDHVRRKNIKLGFDAVELIQNQAIELPEKNLATQSTLNNEIHPIFRSENFHGCSDSIYEVLKPALRLSTLLLLSRGTSAFWHTLVFGERKLCNKTSETYGQACHRIANDTVWSDQYARRFKDLIDRQVDTVHFMFHRNPLPPDPAYASMGLVADYKNGLMRKIHDKCYTSRICLHSDFYTTAKKLSVLQYPEPAMVLRFNLFLAVCIAHEMAHFIEVSGPHRDYPIGQPEVFFYDNMWTESGIAFELKVFGGRLHPISSRVDCGWGLAVLNYPLRELYEKEDNVMYTLPMEYITMLQLKETWERDFSNAGPDFFHVPRTGCRSMINGINLMVWEDEKDVDVSDDIDQLDTMFKRKDDGSIIKNPHSNNRRPQRLVDGRRWSPYAQKRKDNTEAISSVVTESVLSGERRDETTTNQVNENQEEAFEEESSFNDDNMA